jgi:hypothetical protein
MKKSTISFFLIAACIFAFFMISSFKTIPSTSTSKALTYGKGDPVVFSGSVTSSDGGSTYYGPVTATGAINASGTFVMPTEVHGMALHCIFVLTFPQGTITIRMNCNMVTSNGQWKVLDGTGAYQNLKGGGSLVMPNENDEILTGTVSGL